MGHTNKPWIALLRAGWDKFWKRSNTTNSDTINADIRQKQAYWNKLYKIYSRCWSPWAIIVVALIVRPPVDSSTNITIICFRNSSGRVNDKPCLYRLVCKNRREEGQKDNQNWGSKSHLSIDPDSLNAHSANSNHCHHHLLSLSANSIDYKNSSLAIIKLFPNQNTSWIVLLLI